VGAENLCHQAIFMNHALARSRRRTWKWSRSLTWPIARGVKRGVASSVIRQQWEAAEIYPLAANPRLTMTPQQAEQLRLFAP
jgi:hypothetical protein